MRMVTNVMTIIIANIRVKITTENAIKTDESATEIEERNEEGASCRCAYSACDSTMNDVLIFVPQIQIQIT